MPKLYEVNVKKHQFTKNHNSLVTIIHIANIIFLLKSYFIIIFWFKIDF